MPSTPVPHFSSRLDNDYTMIEKMSFSTTRDSEDQYIIRNNVEFGEHYDAARTNSIIRFQSGPIKEEHSLPGCFVEDLIEICLDRLNLYQSGKFPCKYNAEAIDHLTKALIVLCNRTRDRMNRGVEGTNQS